MISVQNVSKNFGPIKAVDQLNFEIGSGEVVGFLGPNGAGKSTTMRMLTGFILPSEGSITINGIDVLKNTVAAQKITGYLPESVALYPEMNVTDFLLFMARMRGVDKTKIDDAFKKVTTQCHLASVLNRKIGDLSKGFKQRVGLAQALIHDPEVLILDEPTVGLDPNQIIEIRELIKSIGTTKTVLLSTHILSEVIATCTRILVINKGKIVAQGTPENLMANHHQGTKYNVSIRGELKTILLKLSELSKVKNITHEKSEHDLHRIQILSEDTVDISENIFVTAVNHQWRLSELSKEQQNLETVFKNLTQ